MGLVVLVVVGATVSGVPQVQAVDLPGVAAAVDPVGTVLPLKDFTAIVTDPVHDQEFVSGSPDGDPLVAASLDARSLRTVPGVRGAAGLALSADHRTLYAAVPREHGVAVIDTRTLHSRLVHVGSTSCPRFVAPAAGLLWTLDTCEDEGATAISSVDPVSGAVHMWTPDVSQYDELTSSPALPGQLLTGTQRLAVTGGEKPTLRPMLLSAGGSEADVAVTPDGRQILAGSLVLDSRTSLTVDSHPAISPPGEPASVTVREDGAVAIGATGGVVEGYAPGQTVPVATYVPALELAFRGIAFGRTNLYAVSKRLGVGSNYQVRLQAFSGRLTTTTWVGRRSLPLTRVAHIVADPRHEQAFVSAGYGGNGVVVTDGRGRVKNVLQHLSGAEQMALSPDRQTLYVALRGISALAAVDTRTLKVRRYPTGPGTCPLSLAVAAGLVWFANCPESTTDSLAALEPRTGKVHHRLLELRARQLVSTPALGNVIIAASTGYHLPTRVVVRGGSHPVARLGRVPASDIDTADLAVGPDGMNVVFGAASISARLSQSTRDLSVTGLVPSKDPVVAVAIRDDGLTASGMESEPSGADAPGRDGNIQFSRQPAGPATGGNNLPRSGLYPQGLAFGKRALYALVETVDRGAVVQVVPAPAVHDLSVSTDRGTYASGTRVQIVGHLDTAGHVAGRLVSVYLRTRGTGRQRRLVVRGRTDARGNFSAAVTVRVLSQVTFVVARSGSLPRLSRTVTIDPDAVLRERVQDLARISDDPEVMPGGAQPALVSRVVPGLARQCLFAQIQRRTAAGAWRRAGLPVCTPLGRRGRATFVLPDRHTFHADMIRVRQAWPGDLRDAPIVGPWHVITFVR